MQTTKGCVFTISKTMGQVSIATTVASDIYLVVRSRISISATAKSPTRQSINQMIDTFTRKPLPPLNLYHIGKA